MTWRDLVCRRRKQAVDKLGLNRGWLNELCAYYRGLTMQEFWIRYTLLRMEAAKLWDRKPREGEADYRSFFAETDYFVLRQMYYHRKQLLPLGGRDAGPGGRSGRFLRVRQRRRPGDGVAATALPPLAVHDRRPADAGA